MIGVQKVATVAARLQEAMRIHNKRQADLVNETGIAKGTISNYINGKYEPKSPTLQKLARALNVSEKWLEGYEVPMERKTIGSVLSKSIGKNTKILREEAGMTQSKFANLLGVSEAVVLEIESGKYSINGKMISRICDIFQTTPHYLGGSIIELEDYKNDLNSPSEPKLTEEEQMLIDLFRQIPEDQQRVFLELGKAYANSLKKD